MTLFWRLGILALIGLAGAFLWHDYTSTKADNLRLTTELNNANATISAQEQVLQRRQEILENEREAIDEIENSAPGDDGPIAPVLRRAIERM